MTAQLPIRLALLAFLVSGAAPYCFAQNNVSLQAPATGAATIAAIPWSSLAPHQQQSLSSMQDRWAQLPPAQQKYWADMSNQFRLSSPSEQDKINLRVQDWGNLRGQDRESIRRNYNQAVRSASPETRAQLWELYQTLEPVHKKSLLSEPVPATLPKNARTLGP